MAKYMSGSFNEQGVEGRIDVDTIRKTKSWMSQLRRDMKEVWRKTWSRPKKKWIEYSGAACMKTGVVDVETFRDSQGWSGKMWITDRVEYKRR